MIQFQTILDEGANFENAFKEDMEKIVLKYVTKSKSPVTKKGLMALIRQVVELDKDIKLIESDTQSEMENEILKFCKCISYLKNLKTLKNLKMSLTMETQIRVL